VALVLEDEKDIWMEPFDSMGEGGFEMTWFSAAYAVWRAARGKDWDQRADHWVLVRGELSPRRWG
jgi:hypothetical protein